MLGLDIYSIEVLIPSVIGVVVMASVMVGAFIRVCHLINDEPPR